MQLQKIIRILLIISMMISYILNLLLTFLYNQPKLILFGGTAPKEVLGMHQTLHLVLAIVIIVLIFLVFRYRNKIITSLSVLFFFLLIYFDGSYIVIEPASTEIVKKFYFFDIQQENIEGNLFELAVEPYDAESNPDGYRDFIFFRKYKPDENSSICLFYLPGTLTPINPLY